MLKQYQIGLEVCPDKLYFTVMRPFKKHWQMLQTSFIDVPTGQFELAFSYLRKQIPDSFRQMIIGLPYHQVMMKEIQMDSSLQNGEIYQYLQHEALTFFGKPADYWYLDFEILPSTIPNQNIIRAVAAPQKITLDWEALCKTHGFKLRAIDVDVLALMRLLPWIEGYAEQLTQALIWIKKNEFLFMVIHYSNLIYIKRLNLPDPDLIAANMAAIIQFFSGLYPQYELDHGFLLGELDNANMTKKIIESTALNIQIAKINCFGISPAHYVSMALGIHPYDY